MTHAQVKQSVREPNSCKNCGFCKRNGYCYFLGAKKYSHAKVLLKLNERRIQ